MQNQYLVTQNESGTRLDKFIADKETTLSRSFIQKLISDGYVNINDVSTKPSHNVHSGDVVKIQIIQPQHEIAPQAEDIPIDIVYEDDEIIVVNKPAGMVVHPATGTTSGTLVNALLSHFPSSEQGDYDDIDDESKWTDTLDISSISQQRPGIVHRIDKGTSGLLVVAKTINAYYNLAKQVREHSMTRRYIAVVCGIPKQDKGTIIAPIGRSSHDRKKMAVTPVRSRDAITHFTVLEKYADFSLIEVRLETGRTHQIRVHFAYIGHPVVGDPDYGGEDRALKTKLPESVINVMRNLSRQALHAELLGFKHPKTDKYIEFSAPIPQDMQNLIDVLR
ncbi:MAG: Pseudouridine synthase [Candidatus Poribacteria bacterium]|nr:Pseudouridine synthase [Candidatus Poribacteria bacterium]